jgi:hypothetical protein
MCRFANALSPIVLALSLAASGSASSQQLEGAAARQQAQAAPLDNLEDGPGLDDGLNAVPDETRPQETLLVTDRPGPALEINWATELVGSDYDSGATNPQLADIGFRECHVLCMLDDRCKAYTHNGPTRMCTLKNAAGEKREKRESISTIFIDRHVAEQQSRSAYRGRLAMGYDPSLTWWWDDTAETYTRRTRDSARQYGADCDSEMADLKDVAIHATIGDSGTVGEIMQLGWSGNGLAALDPVWLIISARSPVRFAGKGFYGLNKGAYGPFGIETARDETRALVPLYNQAVGDSGSIGVVPLEAGDTTLTATVVAYLRQCQEVVELEREVHTVSVQPAAPRIVLHNPYALNIYPHKAEIAPLKRRVLYNNDRLLILETELGGEILERSGGDIQFSPTGRYVAVRSDNASEIVDVLDGAVVARIGDNMSTDQDLLWLHGDSFVAVTRPPYGRVWLASTLNPGRPAYYYETGPACCDMSPEDSVVDVNLENNLVRLWGPNAGVAANLADFELGVDLPGTTSPDDEFTASSTLFLDAIGTVSPLPNAFGYNMPFPVRASPVVLGENTVDIAASTPSVPGALGETRGAASLIKPEQWANRPGVDLSQFGFALAKEVPAQSLLSPAEIPDWGGEMASASESLKASTRTTVAEALAARGIVVDWMVPTGDESDQWCEYILDDNAAAPSQLPGSLNSVQRIAGPGGAVWIIRSQCQGGATSATQSFRSTLMIVDEARQAGHPARATIVEQNASDNTQFDYAFYDADFRTKLIDDHTVLFYVPAGGAIALFDLQTRRFTYKQQNLPRGDLLADAHMRAGGSFVLQVNADESFALLRTSDESLVLLGRQLDDETVFWSPDFRFDSTAEGASFVELRFPGVSGQYTFQQFDSRLRRPGLLDAALRGEVEASPVAIHVPPRLTGTLEIEGEMLTGEAIPAATARLKELRLYQDGVLTDNFPVSASGQRVAISARRLPGARWVSLVAADVDDLVSLPVGRDIGADASLPMTHLLAIGINAYEDDRLPTLSLAKADATSLTAALKAVDGKSIEMDPGSTVLLTDAAASRSSIIDAARSMVANTRPGDNAVVSFAGHGLQGGDGRFYLGLSATKVSDIENTALAWDELAAILSTAKGRVTVLLDACHSGTAGTGLLASNDAAVDTIRKAIPSGLTVLSASKGRELSAEIPSLGGGVFTYALTRAIAGDRTAADLNGNGRIEVSELYRYVKDEVETIRRGEQTPWLARNQMIGDFALF